MLFRSGSLAPEIKSLVSSKRAGLRDFDFEKHYEALRRFLTAVRSVDPDGWRSGESPLAKARVLRAILRTLPDIALANRKAPHEVTAAAYSSRLSRIDTASLAPEEIRAVQGSAGIRQIYDLIKSQMGLD